ncbi:MAG TPA: flagellar motor protein MotB [Alphaproteobacteria bacterium]|nr:flagellar motor protein MotB [Alphaproteobacteria bacterium]
MLPVRPRIGDGEGDGGIVLYLAVFVLLLAFFILLNAISTFERRKAGAVLDSLKDSFSAGTLLTGEGDDRERREALAEAARAVESVGELFLAAIPVARIEAASEGSGMVVTLPAAEIFEGDALRADRGDLLDRVAAALAPRAAGVQVRLEFLAGAAGGADDTAPLVAMAGTVARDLLERGAQPAPLSVGIERREAGWVRFLFTIRDPEAPPVRLPVAAGGRR